MEFVKAIEIDKRMVKANNLGICGIECEDCLVSRENNRYQLDCGAFKYLHPEEYEKILEKWDKEHPRKTRLQDFLEKYPKAPMHGNSPTACACDLGYSGVCIDDCEECWNTPIEEI